MSSTRKNQPAGEEFGRFKSTDGREVTAFSAEEAVRYRFDGWQEIAPAAEENREPSPAEAETPAS